MSETVVITALGHSGDGIAETDTGRLFVPFALPDETVTVERGDGDRAELTAIVTASPQRVAAPCPHFGSCGGCVIQHLSPTHYLEWKRDQVVAAFAQRGIETPVAAMIPARPGTRRRAVFTAEREGRSVRLGFNRHASHDVIEIPECKVLVPAIVQSLPAIRALVAPLVPAGKRARVTVLAADNGLDISVEDIGRPDRSAVAAIATRVAAEAIARITVMGEEAYRAREPALKAGPGSLLPPSGGFLQATAEAEEAMAREVLAGVGEARTVADLFSGSGTFTFRLAQAAKVTAVDGDGASVAALQRSIRLARGLKPIAALRRDLFRNPMTTRELKPFDAVVFDPPRAGAAAQAEQLAQSDVQRVVAVSCNPATLARDARILVDGGYRLVSMQPIDQFLWSAHIEAVARFER